MLCLGGSTGGSYLRKPAPHNPDITTAAWIKVTLGVERLEREMAELRREVQGLAQQLAQKGP